MISSKVAIMQPYFLPYIGYWQLMASVDAFVYYDDVSFRKQSWINRNQIYLNNSSHLFTINTLGASSYKLINEINVGNNLIKVHRLVLSAYKNAPYLTSCLELFESIFESSEENLSKFIVDSNSKVMSYLGFQKHIYMSSEMDRNRNLRGQDAVIDICQLLKADTYINLPGGKDLYETTSFAKQNIQLKFVAQNSHDQSMAPDFSRNLSILDLLVNFSKEQCMEYILNYKLE